MVYKIRTLTYSPFPTPTDVLLEPERIFSIKENKKGKDIVLGIETVLVKVHDPNDPFKEENRCQYVVAISDKEKIILGPTKHAESIKDRLFEKEVVKEIRSYLGSFQGLSDYVAQHGIALGIYEDVKDIPANAIYCFEAINDENSKTTIALNGSEVYILFGRMTLKTTMKDPHHAAKLYEDAQGRILRDFYLRNHGQLNEELKKTTPNPSFEIKRAVIRGNMLVIDYIVNSDPRLREIAINLRGESGFTSIQVDDPNKPLEKILETIPKA